MWRKAHVKNIPRPYMLYTGIRNGHCTVLYDCAIFTITIKMCSASMQAATEKIHIKSLAKYQRILHTAQAKHRTCILSDIFYVMKFAFNNVERARTHTQHTSIYRGQIPLYTWTHIIVTLLHSIYTIRSLRYSTDSDEKCVAGKNCMARRVLLLLLQTMNKAVVFAPNFHASHVSCFEHNFQFTVVPVFRSKISHFSG